MNILSSSHSPVILFNKIGPRCLLLWCWCCLSSCRSHVSSSRANYRVRVWLFVFLLFPPSEIFKFDVFGRATLLVAEEISAVLETIVFSLISLCKICLVSQISLDLQLESFLSWTFLSVILFPLFAVGELNSILCSKTYIAIYLAVRFRPGGGFRFRFVPGSFLSYAYQSQCGVIKFQKYRCKELHYLSHLSQILF